MFKTTIIETEKATIDRTERTRTMKKTQIAAALLAAGMITQANAVNFVYITGSTAFRGVVYNSLNTSGAGGVFDATPSITTYGKASPPSNGAMYMLFHGNIGGVETYVDCLWSGSEAGIACVASATPSQTLNDGGPLANVPCYFLVPDININPAPGSASSPTSSQTNSTSTRADLCLADTSQTVSLTRTPALTPIGSASGIVGIVPFTWVKNQQTFPTASWWSNLVNVTHSQLIIQLAGPQVAGYFTGNNADTNNYVYTIGRNKGSGTRVNALADVAYGIGVPVDQCSIGGFPSSDGSTLLLKDMSFWGTSATSNDGYESGGDVSKALSIKGSTSQTDPFFLGTGWMAIGYMGISDATANGNGPTVNWLSLNGAMENNGTVENGTYSFWGHEHLYGQPGISVTSAAYNVGTNLAVIIPTKLGGANPALNDTGIAKQYMHCDKGNGSDTGIPARF
jgi:hypothetical protein